MLDGYERHYTNSRFTGQHNPNADAWIIGPTKNGKYTNYCFYIRPIAVRKFELDNYDSVYLYRDDESGNLAMSLFEDRKGELRLKHQHGAAYVAAKSLVVYMGYDLKETLPSYKLKKKTDKGRTVLYFNLKEAEDDGS